MLPTYPIKNETNYLYCIFTHSPINYLGKNMLANIYAKRKGI